MNFFYEVLSGTIALRLMMTDNSATEATTYQPNTSLDILSIPDNIQCWVKYGKAIDGSIKGKRESFIFEFTKKWMNDPEYSNGITEINKFYVTKKTIKNIADKFTASTKTDDDVNIYLDECIENTITVKNVCTSITNLKIGKYMDKVETIRKLGNIIGSDKLVELYMNHSIDGYNIHYKFGALILQSGHANLNFKLRINHTNIDILLDNNQIYPSNIQLGCFEIRIERPKYIEQNICKYVRIFSKYLTLGALKINSFHHSLLFIRHFHNTDYLVPIVTNLAICHKLGYFNFDFETYAGQFKYKNSAVAAKMTYLAFLLYFSNNPAVVNLIRSSLELHNSNNYDIKLIKKEINGLISEDLSTLIRYDISELNIGFNEEVLAEQQQLLNVAINDKNKPGGAKKIAKAVMKIDDYPDDDPNDTNGDSYCPSIKLPKTLPNNADYYKNHPYLIYEDD